MAKVKVRVLDAVVDGHKKGEVISIDEKSAAYLESIRYVKRVGKAETTGGEDAAKQKADEAAAKLAEEQAKAEEAAAKKDK